MSKKNHILNQKGFTLIEMISIMVIMGVLASISIKRFDLLSDTAAARTLSAGVKELNVRESLTWSNMKISLTGYTTDADVYAALDTNLGEGYTWNPGPTIVGGTLHFRKTTIALTRTASTRSFAARWD